MSVKQLSIKANMIWNSVGSLTYLGCQWLMTVLIVRMGGFADSGLLGIAMTVVGTFGTFANYKMGTYQISDIKRENELGEYFGFRCITLGIAFVACMAYSCLTNPQALLTIALFFIYKSVGLLIDILHGLDQQNRRMDYIGKSFIAQGVALLAGFVGAYLATNSLDIAIIAMTALSLGVLFLFDIPKASQFEKLRIGIGRKKALFFFKTLFPAVLASVAASAIFMVPTQYLFWAVGDEALGIYQAVAAPALVIQMGAVYLYGPLLDIFPKLFFGGDRAGFRLLLLKTVAGVACVGIVCSVALEFFGSWVLQLLYGESIAPYVYLLQPIILSTIMTAYLWFFGDLLIALRDFKANFIGNVAAFAVVIPLSFLCVNLWGMNGVSFAGAAACLVGVAVLLVALVRRSRAGIGDGGSAVEKGIAAEQTDDGAESEPREETRR